MDNNAHFNPNEPASDSYMALQKLHLDSGILGRFFGHEDKAPTYIAGAVVLIVVLAGAGITIWSDANQTIEAWKILSPVITMVLGFIFGRKT